MALLKAHPSSGPCLAVLACTSLLTLIGLAGRQGRAGCAEHVRKFLEWPTLRAIHEVRAACTDDGDALAASSDLRSAPWCVNDPDARAWAARYAELRGVNLGGWLLMERWLVGGNAYVNTTCCGRVESPYNGTACSTATSELTLTIELRARGELSKIDVFRDAYVTQGDFALLRARGVNSVRLPIGYWIVDPAVLPRDVGFHQGAGLRHVDDAVRWAGASGLSVVLELHGAPGGQSGAQTTGSQDHAWTPSSFNASASVEILRTLAQRYAAAQNVIALGLVNEPELPVDTLLPFYEKAIRAIREHMPASRVAVVINLFSERGLLAIATDAWRVFNVQLTPARGFANIIFDLHIYYAFLPQQLADTSLATVTGTLVWVQSLLTQVTGRPVFVGEWSLRLPGWGTAVGDEFGALTPSAQNATLQRFATNQIRGISRAARSDVQPRLGGAFWSWNAPVLSAVRGPGCVSGEQAQWGYNVSLNRGWIVPSQWSAPSHVAERDTDSDTEAETETH
ncbi:hypothetical protein KFE25_001177 [Diacronema lutheri]|uniref:glucan 1,3-beta-glucosidase n=1 Tax=Diacronema lutheri TaxID=2081491 RepID=A0A8J6CBK5_DIALT|nr:hypothetical protein KFE25_001177 [Diacronema lutheri]